MEPKFKDLIDQEYKKIKDLDCDLLNNENILLDTGFGVMININYKAQNVEIINLLSNDKIKINGLVRQCKDLEK